MAVGLARKNGRPEKVGQNDQVSFVAQTQEAAGLARKNGGDRKSEGQNEHLNQSSFVAQTQEATGLARKVGNPQLAQNEQIDQVSFSNTFGIAEHISKLPTQTDCLYASAQLSR